MQKRFAMRRTFFYVIPAGFEARTHGVCSIKNGKGRGFETKKRVKTLVSTLT